MIEAENDFIIKPLENHDIEIDLDIEMQEQP